MVDAILGVFVTDLGFYHYIWQITDSYHRSIFICDGFSQCLLNSPNETFWILTNTIPPTLTYQVVSWKRGCPGISQQETSFFLTQQFACTSYLSEQRSFPIYGGAQENLYYFCISFANWTSDSILHRRCGSMKFRSCYGMFVHQALAVSAER